MLMYLGIALAGVVIGAGGALWWFFPSPRNGRWF